MCGAPEGCEEGMCLWLQVLVCGRVGNAANINLLVLQWCDKTKDAETVYHLSLGDKV